MKNSQNQKTLNNKGFSLVELIIVIAIMAVLVGVLAPQFLKYVDKSRQSADLDNYRAIISAVQVYVAENGVDKFATAETFKLSKDKDTNSTADTNITTALGDAGMKIAGIRTKSDLYGGATVTVVKDGESVTFSTTNQKLASALGITYTAPAAP